jgi:hypothetical protein
VYVCVYVFVYTSILPLANPTTTNRADQQTN